MYEETCQCFCCGWVIVWTTTAFGEEMFFRGYLITRLQSAFTDLRFGNALAVIAPALLFGFAHVSYQGVRGLVMTGLIGLAFGTMFLVFKRNLWPLVLWHGITNSMSLHRVVFGIGVKSTGDCLGAGCYRRPQL